MVGSALNYWPNLTGTGVTSDAYLTGPVGNNTLNFGPHAFKSLSAYNTPDGINSILSWTAVPVSDPNDGLSQSHATLRCRGHHFPEHRPDAVGNAIAAIEGTKRSST